MAGTTVRNGRLVGDEVRADSLHGGRQTSEVPSSLCESGRSWDRRGSRKSSRVRESLDTATGRCRVRKSTFGRYPHEAPPPPEPTVGLRRAACWRGRRLRSDSGQVSPDPQRVGVAGRALGGRANTPALAGSSPFPV